jgi:hypothetical protein
MQPAAALFGKSARHRQPQPGAFPDWLRRKERIRRTGQGHVVHTDTGIRDRQAYIGACLQVDGMPMRLIRMDLLVCSPQCQHAHARHCVASIRAQVDQHGFQLALVSEQRRQVRLQIQPHLDPMAQRVRQDLVHAILHGDRIYGFGAQIPLAREIQQALGDRGSTFGRVQDHARPAVHHVGVRVATLYRRPAAHDRLQHIVDIVRDAAGQLAKSLHTQSVCEFLLRSL